MPAASLIVIDDAGVSEVALADSPCDTLQFVFGAIDGDLPVFVSVLLVAFGLHSRSAVSEADPIKFLFHIRVCFGLP